VWGDALRAWVGGVKRPSGCECPGSYRWVAVGRGASREGTLLLCTVEADADFLAGPRVRPLSRAPSGAPSSTASPSAAASAPWHRRIAAPRGLIRGLQRY
jgi:hypothetical protein